MKPAPFLFACCLLIARDARPAGAEVYDGG